MRLLVISHTPHYLGTDRYCGWGPTVRELDHLAELFSDVTHIAPVYPDPPPSSALAYGSSRIRLRPVEPAGGQTPWAKAGILATYPQYARAIGEELRHADVVHVRCPANISLLALWLLSIDKRPAYRWVKYAGNWQPDGREPRSYRLQRRWLAGNRHRGLVTVNGRWPDQPPHIHSFHNPCLTDEEVDAGRAAAIAKPLTSPIELLFAGALNEGKGAGRVLQVARELQHCGVGFRLVMLGDGSDRPRYEAWTRENGLDGVTFAGWVPRADVSRYYAAAHFILLPSRSEGWPKVLGEAMAFGAVPVAAAVSGIPQILAESRAGVALPPDDIAGMAAAIVRYLDDPGLWLEASRAGVAMAPRFTYRAYQSAVAELFSRAWGVILSSPEQASAPPPAVARAPTGPGNTRFDVWPGRAHDGDR